MMHELMYERPLGDWHPREIYKTAALQEQKERSLRPLAEWFVTLLEEGRLPGQGFLDPRPNFALSSDLLADAKRCVPRLQMRLSDREMGLFLSKHGCLGGKNPPQTARGWHFPPLGQLRKEWEKRYGGWAWPDAQTEWQPKPRGRLGM
jgi:hypothetical protein